MPKYQEHEVDIPRVIQRIHPAPKYSGIANTYAELFETWNDERPIPSWKELEDEWDIWLAEVAAEEQGEDEARQALNVDIDILFDNLTEPQRKFLKSLQRRAKKIQEIEDEM